MTEFWVEVNITPLNKGVREILAIAVKPIIDYFKGQIETWHFLLEPNIRFRIRTQQAAQLDAVRTKIESVLNPLKGNEIADFYYGNHGSRETPTNKYEGEEKDYGVKGWQITQKLMEHTSNAVIEIITKSPLEKPVEWYAERSIHLFLNQIGYDRFQEASLYNLWSNGNLLIVLGFKQNLDWLNILQKKYYDRFPTDKPT